MLIPSVSQPGQTTDLLVSSKLPLALRVGEVLEAEVVNITETSVAIRMKDTILEAQTNVPLKQGETIMVRVEGRESEIRLRLVTGETGDNALVRNTILSALNALKGLRPAADDVNALAALVKNLPASLKEALPELSLLDAQMPSAEGLSGAALKSAVQDSGLFLETKLRLLVLERGPEGALPDKQAGSLMQSDQKAALLLLKETLEKPDIAKHMLGTGVRPEALSAAIDNVLKHTEFFQLQSRLNDTLQVFVPFVWQDLKDGELIFRESESGHSGEQAFSCTVNLDLERAGRVRALVLLQSGAVHVNVLAESERFFQLLRDNSEFLKKQLGASGIKLGNFSVLHGEGMDQAPSRTGGLDIRV